MEFRVRALARDLPLAENWHLRNQLYRVNARQFQIDRIERAAPVFPHDARIVIASRPRETIGWVAGGKRPPRSPASQSGRVRDEITRATAEGRYAVRFR